MEQDIRNKILQDFGSKHTTAISLLDTFEAEEKLSPRISRCIVHLAKGDITEMEEMIKRAKYDWRDVIIWAETIPFEFNQPFKLEGI